MMGASAAAGIQPAAFAIPPIKREGPPELKLGCCAYSFRDYLTGKREPKMTLDDFLDKCAEWKLDGAELTSYYFPKEITEEYLDHLKAKAADLGLAVSGGAVGNTFCLAPGDKREAQLATVKAWLGRTAKLGGRTMRVFGGSAPKDADPEEARRWVVECLQECCAAAAEHRVFLALENHGGVTATPESVLAIAEGVDSEWFGLNMDTGNFRGEDPYADLAKIAPYAVTTHLKVQVSPKGKPAQPLDFQRVVDLLRAVNYRGYLSLEYEAKEDPMTAVPRHLAEWRKLLG
jgi:sugar phosphate isomerase/epimerase